MSKPGIRIAYIYAGTQNSAGLYMHEILKVFNRCKLSYKAYGSYYYPFDDAQRVFFKYTDLARSNKRTKFRPYIRYLELVFALIRVYVLLLRYRPSIINYSLNTSYLPEYLFLKLIRRQMSAKLIITCHDVIPFANGHLKTTKENQRREDIFKFADILLVHNKNSYEDLVQYYKIPPTKIKSHLFPIMDLHDLPTMPQNRQLLKKDIDFLFIGHLRLEKGIGTLLEAWKTFHQSHKDATLYIVGNLPVNSDLNISDYSGLNITFILEYVSDIMYINYIRKAECVVLPYERGTNSGIPSSVLSLGTQLIVSDIPMFRNNSLIDSTSFFESQNIDSLVCKLGEFYQTMKGEAFVETRIPSYIKQFQKEVNLFYENIL